MAYITKTFSQIRKIILQEYRNSTGLDVSDDSDAGIRADGTASVVEGLYHHQNYIQRQLFISTADESYLYIHADELGMPRLGGTKSSGSVDAISNTALTVKAGTQLTDGKGLYWSVVNDVDLQANEYVTVAVIADRAGASWNFQGETLLWVSPAAGLDGTATAVSIAGGADEEELEHWRSRLLERKKLGFNRDRAQDLKSALQTVTGIQDIYVYPKRRGLGSLDAAITAVGNPSTLPSQSLIDAAQAVLDDYAGFWADCRIFSPTVQHVDLKVIVYGQAVNRVQVDKEVKNYINQLGPGEKFKVATLTTRLMALPNVSDVNISPNKNIEPEVNWMHVKWLRAGRIQVELK